MELNLLENLLNLRKAGGMVAMERMNSGSLRFRLAFGMAQKLKVLKMNMLLFGVLQKLPKKALMECS